MCKHLRIALVLTPMCVIKWGSDCHYRWWQLHLFMRAAGCSPATESQTSHMNHLLATIASWRLNLRNDIGTKSYKNITHLAAELLRATLNFKYSLLSTKSNKNWVVNVKQYMQCPHPWFHFAVIVMINVSSSTIFFPINSPWKQRYLKIIIIIIHIAVYSQYKAYYTQIRPTLWCIASSVDRAHRDRGIFRLCLPIELLSTLVIPCISLRICREYSSWSKSSPLIW